NTATPNSSITSSLSPPGVTRDLHSFPTRRSSDLFKINTPAKAYHIDILRIGYYQGNGARKVVNNMLPTATLPQSQPACKNGPARSEEHTSELQSPYDLVCRLLLEKKKIRSAAPGR